MFDVKIIRENKEVVVSNTKKRGYDVKLVEVAFKLDEEWRSLKKKTDDLRRERNLVSQEINTLKKAGKDASVAMKKAKEIPVKLQETEEKAKLLEVKRDETLKRIPNILHADVPIGKDESENVVRKTWGKAEPKPFPTKPHSEFLEQVGLADFDASARVAGKGFYYLKGDLALLNQALIQFSIQHLVKKGYQYLEPPLMTRRSVMDGMVSFEEFDNMIYKIDGEDLYLIGTSEHSIGGMFMDQTIEELPLKVTGYSMCFRKEIGSHGIDEKGLFRTHQFNKVEQFIFCKPEDSWKAFDELLKNTEEIMQALEIPYHVLEMCTGDLGVMKARQYDVEAWFPHQKEYKEVGSCSNLTDHQARRLNIRYRKKDATEYVHTLNNTAMATSRMMIAFVENHLQNDGSIKIPKALQPFFGKKEIRTK
ncbi:MAG: serine--tRNA ligase [Candidatus Woesearchaeota archaeon]